MPSGPLYNRTPSFGLEFIAAAQLADVLKDVFPLTARHKAVSNLLVSLDALFIEALYEWESVFAGQLSNQEITDRRRRLMELRHNIEVEIFPPGELHLPERRDLLVLAEKDATAYLESTFGSEG